jgi:hypothetical protein
VTTLSIVMAASEADGGLPVGVIVFAIIVTLAILGIVTDTFAEGVMVATLAVVIGLLAQVFGPTLWLAVALVVLAFSVRVTVLVLGDPAADGLGGQAWLSFLTALSRIRDNAERDDQDPP